MSRLLAAAVLLVAFACSGAFASEPGQPPDCSDFVFLEPGHSAQNYDQVPGTLGAQWTAVTTERTTIDAGGRRLKAYRYEGDEIPCPGERPNVSLRISALYGDVETLIAYLPPRCGVVSGSYDAAFNDTSAFGFGPSSCPEFGLVDQNTRSSCVAFNAVTGRLHVTFWGHSYAPPNGTLNQKRTCEITGFATQAEIIQTFVPQAAALSFRVPYMPEGMASADHFDTYWGNLTHPLDFTQAHPLQCDYPAAPPHVGDYLTVADTIPTPVPGRGIYYVTAATYQGATRYGRKTTAGHLSGRDPALLPACTTP